MLNSTKFSTRTKFIGLLGVMFVMVVCIIAYLTLRLNRTIENRGIENQINQSSRLVESTGLSVEKELSATFEKIQILAEHPGVKSLEQDECNNTVTSLFEKFSGGILDTLSRMNASGIFYCSSNPASVGFDGKTLDYVAELLAQDEKRPIVSSATQNRLDPSIYFIAMHTPVFIDGDFAGSLGTALFLNELGDELIPNTGEEGQSFILIDERGNQLYNSASADFITQSLSESVQLTPGELNLVLFGDHISFTAEDGTFIATQNIPVTEDTSWQLLFIDEDISSKGIDSWVVAIIVLLSVSVFVLMYGMASLTNIFYLNPMKDLARVAEKIKQSTLNVDFSKFSSSTNPEVAKITELLHDAITQIRSQQDKLEETIKERTGDLEKAKDELEANKHKLESHVKDLEKINNIMVDREIRMKELKKELKDKK